MYSLCQLLVCRDCTTPSHHALATAGVVALSAAPRATTSSSPWGLDAPTGCTNDSCGMHSLMLWCITGDFSACLASFWGCGVILLCLNFSFDCCGVLIVLLCGYILFVPFVVWSWDARNLRHFWSFCGTLLHIYLRASDR